VRLLVTGSSGFVGRHLQSAIASMPMAYENVEVVLYDRKLHLDLSHQSAPLHIIRELKPTHILHLAWASTSGRNYDKSEENFFWMNLTCSLVEQFATEGIVNWVVGTGKESSKSKEEAQSSYEAAKLGTKVEILRMQSDYARWISMPYLFSLYHARPRIMAAIHQKEHLRYPLELHDYLEIRDCAFQMGTQIVNDSSRRLVISRGQLTSNQTLVDRAKALYGSDIATTCSCTTKSLSPENKQPFYFTDKVLTV